MSLMTRVKSRLRQRLRCDPLWVDTDTAPARIASLPEAWISGPNRCEGNFDEV